MTGSEPLVEGEPDPAPRRGLQVERTVLARNRTGFAAAGVGALLLHAWPNPVAVVGAATGVVLGLVLLATAGGRGHRVAAAIRSERAVGMRRREPQLIGLATAALCLAAAVTVLV